MQRKYVIILLITSITIFFPIILFSENESLNNYLLGGFILSSIILFVLGHISQTKRETREDRKEHTRKINSIFIKMKNVAITERAQSLQMVLPTKEQNHRTLLKKLFENDKFADYVEIKHADNYDGYYFFKFAIEHLKGKKYEDIYQHWENIEKLLKDFNKRKPFESVINEMIKARMSEFFPDFVEHPSETDNSYEPIVIKDFICAQWRHQEELSTLIISEKPEKYSIITKRGTRPQLVSSDKSKLDLEKYKKLLKSIIRDESLKRIREEEAETHSKIYEELSQFESKLELLIKKLKSKKLLEGKCDGCP